MRLYLQVWIEAAFQIFYSVGAGFGVHLAMASYNDFHNNCYIDCMVTAGVNSLTSLFSGCTVFIYLGYMSETMKQPIETVASQGIAIKSLLHFFNITCIQKCVRRSLKPVCNM